MAKVQMYINLKRREGKDQYFWPLLPNPPRKLKPLVLTTPYKYKSILMKVTEVGGCVLDEGQEGCSRVEMGGIRHELCDSYG